MQVEMPTAMGAVKAAGKKLAKAKAKAAAKKAAKQQAKAAAKKVAKPEAKQALTKANLEALTGGGQSGQAVSD